MKDKNRYSPEKNYQSESRCPRCKGKGKINGQVCTSCYGEGKVYGL
jgi:DnaJ-class molecular chaperone